MSAARKMCSLHRAIRRAGDGGRKSSEPRSLRAMPGLLADHGEPLRATGLQPTGLPSTSLHGLIARANFYPIFYPDQRAGWAEDDKLPAPRLFDGEPPAAGRELPELTVRVRFPSPAPATPA